MRTGEEFRTAEPRLRLLDELGLDAALMFPTLASLLEVRLADDPDLTCTVIHAFNQWLYDEWTFNYRDRIFATPIVNPSIPERGVAELDWLLERGAKVVLMRPAPVAGYRGTRNRRACNRHTGYRGSGSELPERHLRQLQRPTWNPARLHALEGRIA